MATRDNVTKGMVAGVLAFFMLAVMNMFAKLLSDTHHVIEIAFYRNIIATLPFLFMIFVMNKKHILKINDRPYGILARAIIGTISLVVTFAAYAAMPMADASAFIFTASLILPILCFFFLKEAVGIYRWSAVIVGFAGVIIMLNPDGNINIIGVVLALSAAFMHAVLGTILRHIGKTEAPETITFYFLAIGTFLTMLALPWVGSIPNLSEMPYILGLGLSGLAAQYLLSIAFGNAPASVITIFNYSTIIWTVTFGFFIWHDWPDHSIWIGSAVVIAANIFIVIREHRLSKKSDADFAARVKSKF